MGPQGRAGTRQSRGPERSELRRLVLGDKAKHGRSRCEWAPGSGPRGTVGATLGIGGPVVRRGGAPGVDGRGGHCRGRRPGVTSRPAWGPCACSLASPRETTPAATSTVTREVSVTQEGTDPREKGARRGAAGTGPRGPHSAMTLPPAGAGPHLPRGPRGRREDCSRAGRGEVRLGPCLLPRQSPQAASPGISPATARAPGS